MANDPRKRQKRLEKKSAKRKTKRELVAKLQHTNVADRLSANPNQPIMHCCRIGDPNEDGICSILFSRRLPNGAVARATFMVDLYCLGVKDASLSIHSNFDYQTETLPRIKEAQSMAPAAVRKLVEEAVDYAAKIGFQPHADYRKARLIFGDIDAAQCTDQFTFGKDGKPFFVAGPRDDMNRCRQVINTLTRTCGEGNFNTLIPLVAGAGILRDTDYHVTEPEMHELPDDED